MILLLTICPETFCYTLTESSLAEIPVIALSCGALEERVKKNGIGWLLSKDASNEAVVEKIEKLSKGLEAEGKTIDGEILIRGFGDILRLTESDIQRLRSKVAYVQQRDDYGEMGSVQVRDIISECSEANSSRALSYSEVNDLIDRVFDAKSKPAKFSGGEQRLLSVLSVIATRSRAELMIIDEPLNNLDFINARNISNLLNKVRIENPRMGLLMISHCRIFPFVTREIQLTSQGVIELPDHYECHSCFGEYDKFGFYS